MTPATFFRGLHNKCGRVRADAPGTGLYFLRTEFPNVLAWCKGGKSPWGIETFEILPTGEMRLLSEAHMDAKTRTVEIYRTFWEGVDKPGVQWAPGKTVTFAMVRHDWDAPGVTEYGPAITRTVTSYEGGVYSRTDYMADGTPGAFHETYRFGEFGPMSWELHTPTEDRVETRTYFFEPAVDAPITLFGMLPDGTVGYYWSEGGSGSLPARVPERRPTSAVFPKPAPEPPIPPTKPPEKNKGCLLFGLFR